MHERVAVRAAIERDRAGAAEVEQRLGRRLVAVEGGRGHEQRAVVEHAGSAAPAHGPDLARLRPQPAVVGGERQLGRVRARRERGAARRADLDAALADQQQASSPRKRRPTVPPTASPRGPRRRPVPTPIAARTCRRSSAGTSASSFGALRGEISREPARRRNRNRSGAKAWTRTCAPRCTVSAAYTAGLHAGGGCAPPSSVQPTLSPGSDRSGAGAPCVQRDSKKRKGRGDAAEACSGGAIDIAGERRSAVKMPSCWGLRKATPRGPAPCPARRRRGTRRAPAPPGARPRRGRCPTRGPRSRGRSCTARARSTTRSSPSSGESAALAGARSAGGPARMASGAAALPASKSEGPCQSAQGKRVDPSARGAPGLEAAGRCQSAQGTRSTSPPDGHAPKYGRPERSTPSVAAPSRGGTIARPPTTMPSASAPRGARPARAWRRRGRWRRGASTRGGAAPCRAGRRSAWAPRIPPAR